MATLQATKVLEALRKAKRVGRVEDGVVIDGCHLVMQNLAPEDYDSINRETDELEEMEFLHAYQIGHISRAIVEIEGQDLRNTDFIEDEVPNGAWAVAAYVASKDLAEKYAGEIKKAGGKATVLPPEEGGSRTIKLERHEWLRDNLLSSWGREAVVVAWRKFAELLTEADERAKSGIKFKVPDETPEEQFRRLLGEIKEIEDDLPPELVKSILGDAGFLSKSSSEELEAVNERLRGMGGAEKAPQEPQEGPQEPAQASPVAPEPSATPQPQKAPERPPEAPQRAPEVSPADLMRRRTPVSQQVGHSPVPQAPPPTSAARAVKVPEQLRRAAEANVASMGRSAKIAALEAQVDPTLAAAAEDDQPRRPDPSEVAVLSKKAVPIDGAAIKDIVDRPPPVGINPRFKPPGT